MQAVILIGGMGTRLRPFTLHTPKPLLPVLNRPLLDYQFRILRKHGIREVILCTSYRAGLFKRSLVRAAGGMRLSYVHETRPLGTGGALKNAEGLLKGPALVLNGDILNALDIGAFRRHHAARKAEATIALTRVKDPTLYGLVITDGKGLVRRFLEKPSWDEVETNTVNAGAYIFEPSTLRHIPPGKAYSLERGLFPERLAEGGRLAGWVTGGYWIDIGSVDKYLQVHLDILGGRTPFKPGAGTRLLKGAGGAVAAAGRGVKVAPFAHFNGAVSLGARVSVGKGALLSDCVVLDGARVGDGARLERCVVGPGSRVGTHASLGAGAALAAGSVVGDYSQL